MTTDFDYGALAKAMNDALTYDEAATIAREQIEAAFVDRATYDAERQCDALLGDIATHCIKDTTARAEAAEAEVARLREALAAIEAGTYERKVNMPWRADGKPSKHDTCAHGLFFYETCEGCIDEHVRKALGDAQ